MCLVKDGLYESFCNVEMPAAVSLCRMELNGFGKISVEQIRWVFDDVKFRDYFPYFSIKTLCCGYSLEPPRQGDSNEYHNMFL